MDKLAVTNWRQYPHWARGPAHIDKGDIVLDESRAEEYFLFEPKDLLFDFADLTYPHPVNPDPQRAVAFARRYGLLWHGKEDLDGGQCREPLQRWWEESFDLAVLLDLYIRLLEAVDTNSAEPLRAAAGNYMEFVEGGSLDDDEYWIESASLVLAEVVSIKLKDCKLGLASTLGIDVEPKRPDIFLLAHRPDDLVESAYALFAMAIVHRAPMRWCAGCGRMFTPRSGKQKYHSKSCANTSRWRRWNQKQAK
jgi:hypothetical protein